MSYPSSISRNSQTRGFTLVEMITVVAIITIMTGVVLANFPDFRDRASLELVAQEVSLVIRQAQAFGANTRATGTAFPSYGIYFNTADNTGGAVKMSNKSFILFADKDTNGHFSDGENDSCGVADKECREVFNLQGGLLIQDGASGTGLAVCSSTACHAQNHLNIFFNRPEPEAKFVGQNGADITCPSGSCAYAKITLKTTRNNATRDICIWSTGHIYTKLTCP